MSYVSDKTYHSFSQASYSETSKVGLDDNWVREILPNSTLNDTNNSGFDAAVFRNEKDNQVVIAYRGTEPDTSWGKVTDIETDAFDVIGGRYKRAREMVERTAVVPYIIIKVYNIIKWIYSPSGVTLDV